MTELAPIPLASQTYEPRSADVARERLVNMYVEPVEGGNKSEFCLLPAPGLKPWASVGPGPIRGMILMGSKLYVVSGNELYTVTSSKSATYVDRIARLGNVHMIENGQHVAIATVQELYAANESGATVLGESGMVGAAYQDGYGIFPQGGGEKFFITAVDDMTSLSSLDFSSADTFSDNLVGIVSDHRELWLFGEQTTEIWYNAGDPSFPFVRAQSGFIERGCGAPGSVAKADNVVFWLADNLTFYAAKGYSPQRISTYGIDETVRRLTDPASAWAFTYSQEGHTFYVVNFSDKTLVYDLSTGRWSERKSYGIDRWRADTYVRAFGLDLVGDYESGNIYELDFDTYDEDGETIERTVQLPPVYQNAHRVAYHELRLEVESGTGITLGQGSNPTLVLDWSDDDGRTWSSELTASIGAQGEYGRQVIFTRLGVGRSRTFRAKFSDPVKFAVTKALVRAEAYGK